MIFGDASGLLATPFNPFEGAESKNATVLEACVAHPERFMVSLRSGDPRIVIAGFLTHPDNAAWEVWRGGAFCGILLLDRIVPCVEARVQFVFFDDELASKAPLLSDFIAYCFGEFGFHRLTFEAPNHMTTLASFAKRKLGFVHEGVRAQAYHDGSGWRDVGVMARFAEVDDA